MDSVILENMTKLSLYLGEVEQQQIEQQLRRQQIEQQQKEREQTRINPFFKNEKTRQLTVEFREFIQSRISTIKTFKACFPNFNIEEDQSIYTISEITKFYIKFYIENLASYEYRYLLLKFNKSIFDRFHTHPTYSNTHGEICINDEKIQYYICDNLNYKRIKVLFSADYTPTTEMQEIFDILKFPNNSDRYLMLEKDISTDSTDEYAFGIRAIKKYDIVNDIELIKLLDMAEFKYLNLKVIQKMYDSINL